MAGLWKSLPFKKQGSDSEVEEHWQVPPELALD